jgi:hypothetical protein
MELSRFDNWSSSSATPRERCRERLRRDGSIVCTMAFTQWGIRTSHYMANVLPPSSHVAPMRS